jgi:hypothetical protein
MDNAKDFISLSLENFCFKYGIVLSRSSNYYPLRNGLAKSSNKNRMKIVKKTMSDSEKNWDIKIKYALWEDHIMTKTSSGKILFELMYGMEARLFVSLQILVLHLMQHFIAGQEYLQGRIDQLVELDESRRHDFDQMERNIDKIKRIFDHKAREREIKEGNLLILRDKRKEKPCMHKKTDSLWLGPLGLKIRLDLIHFTWPIWMERIYLFL